MASSNRHWPSLFKSKPSCNSSHLQWQHDINSHSALLSAHCQKPNSYASSGSEERTPEPKPRWNPKPEQIRILESIFNSGMVNPPRDEIRRIRSQLQVYGQVGDANVFYWFQNRKSRSKHKQRHLKSTSAAAPSKSTPAAPPPLPLTSVASTPSTSSSSNSSGSNGKKVATCTLPALSSFIDQNFFQAPIMVPELSLESSVFVQSGQQSYQFCSGELAGGSPEVWGDIIMDIGASIGCGNGDAAALPCVVSANVTTAVMATGAATGTTVNEIQVAKSTVFINDVAYEVIAGPLNIREVFGGEAVLLHSSGHPVLTDEWGLTLQPLHHGASYYLVQ